MAAHLHLAPALSAVRSAARAASPIRVVLADDHRAMRRTLRLLLDSEEGVEVIAEAGDLPTVMHHVAGHLAHVLVIDLQTIAVTQAARGEEYISPRVAAGLEALRQATGEGLSSREIEVVRLIALGNTSAEVAQQLHLSRRTVETHRARVYRKLGFTRRAELVAYALRRGLIGC